MFKTPDNWCTNILFDNSSLNVLKSAKVFGCFRK